MKYQAYPEYKDSGVEWIGVIPIHWYRLKFKFFANQGKVFASGPFGSSIGSQFYRDDGVPVIRGNNLSLDGNKPKYTDDGYVFLTEDKADELSNAEVLAGDLVFTARGTVGQVGLVPTDGSIKWSRAILSANQLRFRNRITNLSSQYLWYLFSSWFIRTQVLLSSDSVAQPNLNLGSLKDLHLLCPSFEEQRNIANFLDHETSKIDTLIEKQQQLIKLLKEKRQAVISHAVTKGLNPNAPMRDSGVEWLGEVPANWEITKAKFVSNIFVPQRNKPELNDDSGVAWATMEDMKNTYIETTKHFVDSASLKTAGSKVLKAGAVIASCVGSFDVASINKIDVIINQQLQAFIPYSIKAEYLRELIGISKSYFELIGTAATLVYVNQQGFENLPVLLPTISEQEKICSHIETECCKFDRLIFLSEETIGLLQERRTALISAAVTGKIDVRNWQAPETLQSNIQTHKEE
ncbi:MAG: restriction endonuclease subunit S [Methylococcales bacterium]